MHTITYTRAIAAPAPLVWEVISDVEGYAHYAPNLSRIELTSRGASPSRRCYDTQGRGWDETCVLWEDGRQYAYQVDTTAPDYPYPFTQLKGTWSLDETAHGVQVTMRFDYALATPWPLSWVLHQFIRRRFKPVLTELMDNWEAAIQARLASERSPAGTTSATMEGAAPLM